MLLRSASLDELREHLAAQPRVWIRLAAGRPQDTWQLAAVEITTGAAPPSWRARRWLYENARFVATTVAGRTAAGWVGKRLIRVKPIVLPVTLGDTVQVERRRSGFPGTFQKLEWPWTEWRLSVHVDNPLMLHGELVADGAPAFLNLDLAAAAFFGIEPSPSGRSFSGSEFIVRHQDMRARFDRVFVRTSDVDVDVSGSELSATTLTLGSEHGHSVGLDDLPAQQAQLPLPGGIPSGGWLVLHQGHEVIDLRGLDPRWGAGDVEFEVDTETRVRALISRGEMATTELKRELPPPENRERVIRVMKTVAAFANAGGGTILFGVNDDGTVRGLEPESDRETIDRITSMITDWVRPRVMFTAEIAELVSRRVLVVDVAAGVEPPYGVGTTDKRIDYYIRRNGSLLLATPSDVRDVIRARFGSDSHHLPTFPR